MDNSFIWKKLNEQEKQEIKENAKKIMDEFANKLEKISSIEKHFELEEGLRDEGSGWETNPEFRSTIFCNAPDTDEDFFVAEKGDWK